MDSLSLLNRNPPPVDQTLGAASAAGEADASHCARTISRLLVFFLSVYLSGLGHSLNHQKVSTVEPVAIMSNPWAGAAGAIEPDVRCSPENRKDCD